MSDQIEMPANCTDCNGVWDLNALYSSPDGAVLCPDCRDARDEATEHYFIERYGI